MVNSIIQFPKRVKSKCCNTDIYYTEYEDSNKEYWKYNKFYCNGCHRYLGESLVDFNDGVIYSYPLLDFSIVLDTTQEDIVEGGCFHFTIDMNKGNKEIIEAKEKLLKQIDALILDAKRYFLYKL